YQRRKNQQGVGQSHGSYRVSKRRNRIIPSRAAKINLQFAGVSEVIRADLAQRTVTGAAAAFAIAHPDARALLRNNHKTAAVTAAGGRIFCIMSRAGLRMIGRWWHR